MHDFFLNALVCLCLHHKGHAVRWAAIHGRRLLAGCAAKDDYGSAAGRLVHGSAAGRLVLVDLDDVSSSTNAGQRIPGVGSSPLDAYCGLIGTGTGAGGNGIPEQMGWVGLGRDLVGLDLELEHATTQQRPLRTAATVRITERMSAGALARCIATQSACYAEIHILYPPRAYRF